MLIHRHNFSDFTKNDTVLWEDLYHVTVNCLRTKGWSVIIHQVLLVDGKTFLTTLSSLLNSVDAEPEIHNVKVYDNARFEEGIIVRSTTNLHFDCHTDSSQKEQPHDVLLLFCETPDESGGESIVINIDDVVLRLSSDDVELLKDKVYPFRFGLSSIIYETDAGYTIRYNRELLDIYKERTSVHLTDNHVRAIKRLDSVLKSLIPSCKISLQRGDCLIINNHKVLHGRTGFSSESKRLLNRVRLYCDEFEDHRAAWVH